MQAHEVSGHVWRAVGVSVLLECSWMAFSPMVDKHGYVVLDMFLRCVCIIPGSAIHSFYC